MVKIDGDVRHKAPTHKQDGAPARVQHPQGLVLAGGEDPGAVPVPAGAVDEVRVHAVHPDHRLPPRHVPQDHHVVAACRQSQHQDCCCHFPAARQCLCFKRAREQRAEGYRGNGERELCGAV